MEHFSAAWGIRNNVRFFFWILPSQLFYGEIEVTSLKKRFVRIFSKSCFGFPNKRTKLKNFLIKEQNLKISTDPRTYLYSILLPAFLLLLPTVEDLSI